MTDISVDAVTDLASATFSGEIQNIQLGDNCETFSITNQGFVYSTSIQPTIEDNVVNANGESVAVSLDGLAVETTYYVRTFITNVLGTFYGNEVLFTTPESVTIVNEEEVITTLNVYFDNVLTLQFRDLDGDGPNDPIITSMPLSPFTTYNVNLEFLNELEEPAVNHTYEINEENLDYQIFVSLNNGSDVSVNNFNLDEYGNILGTQFQLTTGSVSEGTITITLVHEPLKPNDGLESAGGDIDIQATFNVLVYN